MQATTGYAYLDDAPYASGQVLAIAHRGGAGHPDLGGLENSLAAFQHAADLGYRYLETDVHATTDGVLFSFHDARLDRITDGQGRITDLTAAQVRGLRIAGVHPVPTLGELLEALPHCRFNVDLKSASAVEPMARLVQDTGCWDRVLVASFSRRLLDRFRQLSGGRVATSAAPAEVAAALLARTGPQLRAWTRSRVAALQVPPGRYGLPVVTPGFVARAHAARVPVHVWTIDDERTMHRLLDMGVDGVMTDRTDVLKNVLVARGQWQGREP